MTESRRVRHLAGCAALAGLAGCVSFHGVARDATAPESFDVVAVQRELMRHPDHDVARSEPWDGDTCRHWFQRGHTQAAFAYAAETRRLSLSSIWLNSTPDAETLRRSSALQRELLDLVRQQAPAVRGAASWSLVWLGVDAPLDEPPHEASR